MTPDAGCESPLSGAFPCACVSCSHPQHSPSCAWYRVASRPRGQQHLCVPMDQPPPLLDEERVPVMAASTRKRLQRPRRPRKAARWSRAPMARCRRVDEAHAPGTAEWEPRMRALRPPPPPRRHRHRHQRARRAKWLLLRQLLSLRHQHRHQHRHQPRHQHRRPPLHRPIPARQAAPARRRTTTRPARLPSARTACTRIRHTAVAAAPDMAASRSGSRPDGDYQQARAIARFDTSGMERPRAKKILAGAFAPSLDLAA
jgi:hypothetical protein